MHIDSSSRMINHIVWCGGEVPMSICFGSNASMFFFLRQDCVTVGAVSAPASPAPNGDAPPAKLMRSKTLSFYMTLLGDLGSENDNASQRVYLGTASRVLPAARLGSGLCDAGSISKADFATIPRDCVDNPLDIIGAPGRPRGETGPLVDFLVVVRRA